MDMSYATIPGIGGNKRLYSKKRSPYIVNIQESPNTNSIYVDDRDPRSSIFFNDGVPCDIQKTYAHIS